MDLTIDEINQLPPMEFNGRIVLITRPTEARAAAADLAKEKILGFDTETRPSFKKGEEHQVALLQLATDQTAYLFRLCKSPMLAELAPLLSDPAILKVGVATRDDVKGLLRLHDFDPAGFVDIALKVARAGKTPGLRTLAAEHLGLRITKAAKTTNWEAPRLTDAQLAYAAKDAVAGFLIYQQIFGQPSPQSEN